MTYKIVKKMSSEQILGRNLNEAMGHVNHLKIKEKNTFKLQLVSPAKCAGETVVENWWKCPTNDWSNLMHMPREEVPLINKKKKMF